MAVSLDQRFRKALLISGARPGLVPFGQLLVWPTDWLATPTYYSRLCVANFTVNVLLLLFVKPVDLESQSNASLVAGGRGTGHISAKGS